MEHGSVSINQLFEYFEVASLVQGATKHKCRTASRKFVALFGNIQAGSVTVPMVGQWQVWLGDEQRMSPASVRSYYAAMAQIFTWARDAEVLVNDAWSRARQIRQTHREVITFDAGEVADLVDAAARIGFRDPSGRLRWTAIVLMAADSGLRIGEILNLRWEDLDLDQALVHVQYRPDAIGEHWTWGSKTATDRIVPIGGEALEVLYRLSEVATWRYPLLKRATCIRLQGMVGTIPEDVRKFPYRNLHREFRKIKAAANAVRQARGRPEIRDGCLHQLRKTAVTNWARNGVPLIDAQCVAGHRNMATTRNYYIAIDAEASAGRVRTAIDANPGRK